MFQVFSQYQIVFLIALLVTSAIAFPAHAAPQGASADQKLAEAVEGENRKLPTVEQIAQWQKQLTDNAELEEDVRNRAVEALKLASDHVTAAQGFEKKTEQLAAELESLPQELKKLESALQQPLVAPTADNTRIPADLAELQTKVTEAETGVAAAIANRDSIAAELTLRNERRPGLPELIAKLRKDLSDTTEQRKSAAAEPVKDAVGAADRIRLQTREHRLTVELAMAEQESRTYEATTRLWVLKRDDAERQVNHLRAVHEFWQKQLAAAKRREADREATALKAAAALSLSALKTLAEDNADLAVRNAELVEQSADLASRLMTLRKRSDDRREAFDSLKKRAEAANFSPAIGVLLRVQQSTLPRTDNYAARADERQEKISDLNVEIIEWDAERRSLLDIPAAVAARLRTLSPDDRDDPEVETQLNSIITKRRELLGELLAHAKSVLDELVRFDGLEKSYLNQLNTEREWLAEHVLWVRSAELLGKHPESFVSATRTLFDLQVWKASSQRWAERAWDQRWLLIPALMLFTSFAFVRHTFKKRLRELGRSAARSHCVQFLPTLQALGYTLLIALPLPLMVIYLGRETESFAGDELLLPAIGRALQLVGVTSLLIEIIRQLVTTEGLAECHLGWSQDVIRSLRSAARLLLFVLLIPILACAYTEFSLDDQLVATWGRVAFLVALAGAGVALFRMMRLKGPVVLAICASNGGSSLLKATRWLWSPAFVAAPVVLATLSVAGWHYTAVRLAGRVAVTLGIGFASLLLAALLTRWLLVVYRRLAMERARERRRQLQELSAVDENVPVPPQQPVEIQLDDVNQQTRRLIRLGCTAVSLLALYFVWADTLPAFGFLEDVTLWPNNLITVDEGEPQPWVSLGDVLVFLLAGALTIVAARNIPGLMEIAVLQRLPMDAGARYAASMISRYLITAFGFVYAFNWIGVGWASVQWLVAAMTVGLGFGLQEIFANFVSGIILLFERPVRVGDTVTIGDITGTVSRIQIRATTLVDWDNRELIVPNRDFVTGNLVNWTLSDPTLRLVCRVGVAYGSNTRLATELLYQIAADEPEILNDPEPVVVFNEFGDNSLNFELRVFVNGLTNYRRLKHRIHLAMDDEFRRHKIEIAFPQRDLHLRSLPSELAEAVQQLRPSANADDHINIGSESGDA